MNKLGYLYILTNWNKTVLYTGVTSRLVQRIYQHRQSLVDGFTKRYNCRSLVYYEVFEDIREAIKREKAIKGWKRERKEVLVNSLNPDWKDLYEDICPSEG